MRLMTAALAMASMTIAGCATVDDSSPGHADHAAPDQGMTPTERGAYVQMAGASDLYEIQSSRIALEKSRNQDVRQFAQMLTEHHTKTTQTLMAAAKTAGLQPPPPVLMPMQRDMLAQLQQADAAGFDQVFLRQQVRAHEMALALHQNYARAGDTPALKTAASTAVPIIEQHLTRARQLNR